MNNPVDSFCLQSTLELHHVLFDAMTDGVLLIDQKGLFLDCNPAIHQRLGYEKRELIGKPVAQFMTPDFSSKLHERISRMTADGGVSFETACVHRDGSLIQVDLCLRCIEADTGTLLLGIVREITPQTDLAASLRESLDVYRAAINTPALGFWATDMQGSLLEVNDAYVKLSGYSREELLGMHITDIEAVEKLEETAKHIEKIVQTGFDRFRSEHRKKDGTLWPVEIVTSYSPIQGGRFFVFIEDISERIVQENRLELASRVFETMEQAVIVTDAENRIVLINPAATCITGYNMTEVQGKNPRIFSSGRHDRQFFKEMWDALNCHGQWEGEIWDRRKDGEVYAKWMSIKVIYDKYGRVYQYVSVFSDITERKKMEEGIWRQANFDSLTGLPNRYLLLDHLEQETKKAQRSGSSLAVLFIDLDRFKEVNDTFGHAKGDALLIQAARRIGSRVRNTDTIARLGGDEFTVLLPDFGDRANLQGIVQNLILHLAEPYRLEEDEFAYVTASIGIALYPDDASDLLDLLKCSDKAMYVAKTQGRNRFSYFTSSPSGGCKK